MGSSDFQAESAASSAAQLASDGFNILPSFGLNLRTVYVGLCHGDRAARTAFVEPRSACMRDGPPIPGSAATDPSRRDLATSAYGPGQKVALAFRGRS